MEQGTFDRETHRNWFNGFKLWALVSTSPHPSRLALSQIVGLRHLQAIRFPLVRRHKLQPMDLRHLEPRLDSRRRAASDALRPDTRHVRLDHGHVLDHERLEGQQQLADPEGECTASSRVELLH